MSTKWIAHETDQKQDFALYCFHHAGGTAAYFAKWGAEFENIAVLPVQFPMREKRIKEKMPDSMQELVKDFVDENIGLLKERKFGLFGHCSGSIAAYEAAKYAKEAYGIEPEILFVSSCYAPDDYRAPMLSALSDEELLHVIKEAGYVTPELLENPFMFEYFAPIVRKDFFIQENYKNENNRKLNVPVVAMYGKEDLALEEKSSIGHWKNYTSGDFAIEEFHGSHFYLEEELDKVAAVIDRRIMEVR